MPMLFDERETRHIRIWGEAHPHLGGGTSASGRRRACVQNKRRPHLRLETIERETMFADK